MVIYIAGKINGDADYRRKFKEKEMQLRIAGHTVLNPAIQPHGLKNADYMRICFAMMEAAEAVLFLDDWKESKGARLEFAWCEYVGKRMLFDGEGV